MALDKSGLFSLIGTTVPDNNTGLVTPAKLREVLTQTADSMLYAATGVKEVEVLRAPSTVAQAPTAVDTPLQLTFGAAQGTVANPVSISAVGLVTFNAAGSYAIRVKTQNGRTGATGTSILLTRILINGTQYGSPASTRITATDSTVPTESRFVVTVTAGTTLAVQIMRDSAGSNFGGVYPQTATVTAWGVAPSALLVVSRLEAV